MKSARLIPVLLATLAAAPGRGAGRGPPAGPAHDDHVRLVAAVEREAHRARRRRGRLPARLDGIRGSRAGGAGVVSAAHPPQGPHAGRWPRAGALQSRPLPPVPRRLDPRRDPRVAAGEASGHRGRHGRRRQPLPGGVLPGAVGSVRAADGRRGHRVRDGEADRLTDAGGAKGPPGEKVPRRRRSRRPAPRGRARAVRARLVARQGPLRRRTATGVAGRGARARPRRLRPLPLRWLRRHEGRGDRLLPRREEGRPVVVRRPRRPPLPLPRRRRHPAGDGHPRRRARGLLPRASPAGRPPRARAGRRSRRLVPQLEPAPPLR